jgi:Ca2+-binding EF-hand superfamily protein
MYVALALREKASNIRKPEWVHPDGRIDPLVLGVPRSWEDMSKIEQRGIFRGTYVCAPEDRSFEFRCKLAATYGHFPGEVEEADVRWWTGLTEPPADVLKFLEFLIGHVDNMNEAFNHIDSSDGTIGNGFITLRELEKGIIKMGCKKFRGKHEKDRIGNIFRYLDRGMEGTISLKEWQLLDQLWQEFDLSIREFVHFLALAFGEDLPEKEGNCGNTAWAKMDTDRSGGISQEEWRQAVENIGYFGPSRVVFALLDRDDDGVISYSEYEVLERYRPERPSK